MSYWDDDDLMERSEEFDRDDREKLDFVGELPMSGVTIDGIEYSISGNEWSTTWRVWITKVIDDESETEECVFTGTKCECMNWVFWNLEVAF